MQKEQFIESVQNLTQVLYTFFIRNETFCSLAGYIRTVSYTHLTLPTKA